MSLRVMLITAVPLLLLWAAPLASASGSFGTNLIANPDFEDGTSSCGETSSIPSWTTITGGAVIQYACNGYSISTSTPAPPIRGTNLWVGGNCVGTADDRQVVDLSWAARDIDAHRVVASLDGWFGGYDGQRDYSNETGLFEDAHGNVLNSTVLGNVMQADRAGVTELLERNATMNVPALARSAVVDLRAVWLDGACHNDGSIDALSLVLAASPPAPLPELPTVWLAAIGLAGVAGAVVVRRR